MGFVGVIGGAFDALVRVRSGGDACVYAVVDGGRRRCVGGRLSRWQDGDTAIIWAARCGTADSVKVLIASGADVNKADNLVRAWLFALS